MMRCRQTLSEMERDERRERENPAMPCTSTCLTNALGIAIQASSTLVKMKPLFFNCRLSSLRGANCVEWFWIEWERAGFSREKSIKTRGPINQSIDWMIKHLRSCWPINQSIKRRKTVITTKWWYITTNFRTDFRNFLKLNTCKASVLTSMWQNFEQAGGFCSNVTTSQQLSRRLSSLRSVWRRLVSP